VRLTVVGCAGSFPSADSAASCYLVEADGVRIVLDLGSGALGPLQRYTRLGDVSAVLLSHLHADHCLDLTGLYVARRFDPSGPQPAIPVYGPEGTAARMARAYDIAESPGMTREFDFRTWPATGSVRIGPFTVTTARMAHPVPCFAMRVEAGGRTLVYSGDTGPTAALVDLARGADVGLIEASFVDGANPPDLHLTAREAAGHARAAGVGRLVLTHLVAWNARSTTLAEAMDFDGPVSLAEPGMVIDV
jgi:ribonuclease BN (tRNA processing enzyme)